MTPRKPDESGFTLVELLVVLVIMPMIVGAIAAAIIVSEKDSGVTSTRLNDSSNAQITSAYYVRDVQGAQFVTTTKVTGPFTSLSPPVCVNPSLGSPSVVLGLYRPATQTVQGGSLSNALSVGYWLTGGSSPQLVRDACSVIVTSGVPTTTFSSEVLISDDVTSSPVIATVVPSTFAKAASNGWTPTTAATTVTSPATLGSTPVLSVVSTIGFQTGAANPLTVLTGGGVQTVTCTGPSTPTTFTTCTGGTGTADVGSSVSQQDSISGINLSVTEPGSTYSYSLQAAPRTLSSQQSGISPPGPPFGAALVVLGSADLGSKGSASVTIDGDAEINGNLTMAGGETFTASGNLSIDGTVTCGSGTLQTGGGTGCGGTGTATVTDPLANFLPSPVPVQPAPLPGGQCVGAAETATGCCPSLPSTGTITLLPGTYTCALNTGKGGLVILLQPGVYQLDGGLSVTGGNSVAMASGANGQGALLYFPPLPLCTQGAGTCNDGLTVGNGTGSNPNLSVPPLTAAQSIAAFGTTTLQDVWLWQNVGDTTPASIGGGGIAAGPGLAYMPGAQVTFAGGGTVDTGRFITAGLQMSGGTGLTVTGQ